MDNLQCENAASQAYIDALAQNKIKPTNMYAVVKGELYPDENGYCIKKYPTDEVNIEYIEYQNLEGQVHRELGPAITVKFPCSDTYLWYYQGKHMSGYTTFIRGSVHWI